MIVPPDGGWGWVIVAASFMCNVVVDGIIFSFGAFLPKIGEHFTVSKASVAMVGSLQTGFYLITGGYALLRLSLFRYFAISHVGYKKIPFFQDQSSRRLPTSTDSDWSPCSDL